jgi:hypothetical protein
MATISQRITLDGAEEIRKKLEELGAAGENAFKQIQDAAKKPIVDPAQINKSKQAFDQLATAAKQTGNAIAQAGQQAEAAGSSIGNALRAASSHFVVTAGDIVRAISAIVSALSSGAGETAQALSDQANRLGLSLAQWLKLRQALEVTGQDTDKFMGSTVRLVGALNQITSELNANVQQYTVADGKIVTIITSAQALSPQVKAMAAEFQKFGVTLEDLRKGDTAAIMQKLATTIARMPEGAAKAAAGMRFFGAQWRDTIETLTKGTAAVENWQNSLDTLRKVSRILTEEQQKDAKNAADQWDDLGKAVRALKDKIGAFLAPGSEARAKWLTDIVDDARILLTTFLKLDSAAARANFLQNLPEGAGATAFKILIALGQQLAGVWDVLVAAGGKLMGVFDGIAGIFEGITGSQVAAFFITAAIAATGLAIALKGIALVLSPLTALISLVFGPIGPLLLAAAIAVALFWDKLKQGAATATSLVSVQLQDIGDSLKKLFAGDFSGFWEQFSNAAIEAFAKIGAAAEANQGVVGQVFRGIKQIIADLPGAIELVIGVFIALGAAAQGVADIINKVLGTKLTGTDIALLVIVGQMTGAFGLLAAGAVIASNAIAALGTAFSWVVGVVVAVTGLSAAVAGVVVAVALLAAALIVINWDSIKNAAVTTWNAITSAIGTAATAVVNFASSMLGIAWDTIKSLGVATWTAITSAVQDAIDAVLRLAGLRPSAPAGATAAPGKASGGLIGGLGSGTSDSNLAWVSRGEHIMPASIVRQPGVLAFLEALRRGGGIPGFQGGGSVGFSSGGQSVFVRISEAAMRILEQFPLIQQMLDNMVDTLAEMGDVELAAKKIVEFLQRWGLMAGGGLIGGRGSGTSDSNLAWVSRGEFVMPARAVRQPGMLAFLEALRSGVDLKKLLGGIGRFAAGGPVAMPALARGGIGNMSHVTIQFPGLAPIGGLRASSDVVEQLQRAAAMAQVRSGGRKPSRYT